MAINNRMRLRRGGRRKRRHTRRPKRRPRRRRRSTHRRQRRRTTHRRRRRRTTHRRRRRGGGNGTVRPSAPPHPSTIRPSAPPHPSTIRPSAPPLPHGPPPGSYRAAYGPSRRHSLPVASVVQRPTAQPVTHLSAASSFQHYGLDANKERLAKKIVMKYSSAQRAAGAARASLLHQNWGDLTWTHRLFYIKQTLG